MTILHFSDIPVLCTFLQEIIEHYLLGDAKSRQILHLHNVTVDPKTILHNNLTTIIRMIVMKEKCLLLKQLKLSQVYLPSRMAFWLFHSVHLIYLHKLEIHGVTIDPPHSILHLISKTSSFHVQELCFSNIDIPRCDATAEDFRCLMTKKYLRNLSITNCNLGDKGLLQDLTSALFELSAITWTAPPSFIELLNLSNNRLGSATHYTYVIQHFFNALFQMLPFKPNLSLNICDNELKVRHFLTIYTTWAKRSGGRKLRKLLCQKNELPRDKSFLSQMAEQVLY